MRKLIPLIALGAIALAACGSESDAAGTDNTDESTVPTTTSEFDSEYDTPIATAVAFCEAGTIGDEGTSVTFDTKGEEEYGTKHDDYFNVACALATLGVPDHVMQRMDNTRALDGTMDAAWENEGIEYEAFWNYHPDSGMSLTIYEA